MDKIVLAAASRTVFGKQNIKLRKAGRVPAVIYGHGKKPESIELDATEIERAYRSAGGNKIIAIRIDDARSRNAVFYDVQKDARGGLKHADFYLIKMTEELKAEVPLRFTGESEAVFRDGGSLMKSMETIEVECLPASLPEFFEIDISKLDDFEETITVGDLAVPEGVKLTTEDLSALIAKVEPPRSDEEIAELDEAVVEELPEGVEEEKPEVLDDFHEEDADKLTMK